MSALGPIKCLQVDVKKKSAYLTQAHIKADRFFSFTKTLDKVRNKFEQTSCEVKGQIRYSEEC